MNIVSLARRNLFRHRKRTFITASALTFGLVAYIYTHSLLRGAEIESERNFRQYETGDGRIAHHDYWEDHERLPINRVLENPEKIVNQLRSAGIRATPRVHFSAELIVYRDPFPEDGSLYAQVFGIDTATDHEVFALEETLAEGRFIAAGDDGVVLGGWLAEDLGARVGYPLTISTRTRRGYRQTIDTEVVGILNCPNSHINRTAVFMSLQSVDEYLQMEGAVTEVTMAALRPEDGAVIDTVVAQNPTAAYLDFAILAEDYLQLTEAKNAGSQIMLFVLFVIAAVGISNTMLVTVLERTPEIGMLRAFGMRDGHIARMMLCEAAGIGLLGAVAGVIIGALLNIQLVNIGINYGAWLRESDFGYRISTHFRGAWSLDIFVTAFVVSIFLAVATALFPVRRILRKLSIVDCLRKS